MVFAREKRTSVDVAVQSYRKPELLLHSLLTLHAVSKDRIDRVFIDDDRSPEWICDFYASDEFAAGLRPWRIGVRRNDRRMGWWYAPVEGQSPRHRWSAATVMQTIRFSDRNRAHGRPIGMT